MVELVLDLDYSTTSLTVLSARKHRDTDKLAKLVELDCDFDIAYSRQSNLIAEASGDRFILTASEGNRSEVK